MNKETIETLENIIRSDEDIDFFTYEEKKAIGEAIEALRGGWIPVSERLPEKNMACLVAVGELNLTQMAMYSDLMGIIDHRIFYQGDTGYDNFENITQYVNAWQPLPEPYKKGE